MDPEGLYRQLGQLVAEIPIDLAGPGSISPETRRWLGRAATLVAEASRGGDATALYDQIAFTTAADGLASVLREQNAHQIVMILHRSLARAELKAPAAAQGAFIPVGGHFDVFQTIGKILSEAKVDVLFVDAYMGPKVLMDFAPLASEHINMRLLADSFSTKAELLRPAATRWTQQYGSSRPLEIRLTAPRALHDRLMIVDGSRVWSMTQSFEHFAARSPASILRVERDIAEQKVHAYDDLWRQSNPI